MPVLTGDSWQLASRILVSFILYTLYAPHPIAVNPFKSAIFATYLSEREKAVKFAYDGGVSPNEQLVWVLWKILKGDGNDVSDNPFSSHSWHGTDCHLSVHLPDWTLPP